MDFILNRINKLKEYLAKNNLDGIYITNLTNVRYLSGFTGSSGFILIYKNKNYFFSDGRYKEQSGKEIHNYEIQITSNHLKTISEIVHIEKQS